MPQDKTNIYAYVRQQEYLYRSGATTIAKYVQHSLSETIQTIYAYLNSQFTSGKTDSLNRDKPFFNIVTSARNIWYRATTLERKDIIIRETNSKLVIPAFLATQKLQEWMRHERFGVFLSEWGLTLAGFGSAISKWIKKDGKLIPSVVPWDRMICDTIDFDSNPKIEIFEFTADQLRSKKEYDQEAVKSLLNSPMIRMTITQELQDVKPYYYKIYEVHGKFPLSYLTNDIEKDGDTYVQQMHVVAYTRTSTEGKYNDFSLFKGLEETDPYRCDSLIKEDGRTLGIGAVENLFNAQWMVNHSMKAIKDQLDLASKIVFQTSDPTFTGLNALTSVETGQIMNHKAGEPITAFPNGSHDTGALTSFAQMWKAAGAEVNGITDAMAGVNPKSGTSWRLQSLQVAQAQQLFDLMRVNKALALEDMLRERIIPYLKTQLSTNKEIMAVLDANNIKKIDSIYVPQEAVKRYNKKVIDHVLKNGSRPIGIDLQSEMQQVQNEVNNQGNVRFFKPSEIENKTWREVIKDLEWELGVDIAIDPSGTTESSDNAAILQTLNTALGLVMNPNYASNPQAQMIVNKILMQTGKVSPLEIAATPPPTPPVSPPQNGGAVGGGQGEKTLTAVQ